MTIDKANAKAKAISMTTTSTVYVVRQGISLAKVTQLKPRHYDSAYKAGKLLPCLRS